jgi:hypothetical protein
MDLMVKEVTSAQLSKETHAKLSSFRRKMSLRLDPDLTFDQLIDKMIEELE